MNNYFESPFVGKSLKEQVTNPNIIVGEHSYYSGYYHKHSFATVPAIYCQIEMMLITLTLAEEGCLIFEVTQCDIEPCRFNVYEEFIDMAAFECHQRRVKASYWGKVTQDVERHYTLVD